MRTTSTTGDCPVQEIDEAQDFFMRLAEAIACSLAQEDNELDMAKNEAVPNRAGLQ